mmetsp:Transcript_92933/g.240574  ORF Transcript_92933/g.240574 Transcript_92933/m.240574 type:complete len:277 (-) Transcript_92933:60-890(-)
MAEQPRVGATFSDFPAWECLRFSHPGTYEALKRSARRRYGAVALQPISRPGSSSGQGPVTAATKVTGSSSELQGDAGGPSFGLGGSGLVCERRGREHHRRSSSSRRRSNSRAEPLNGSRSTPSLPGIQPNHGLHRQRRPGSGAASALSVSTKADSVSIASLPGGGEGPFRDPPTPVARALRRPGGASTTAIRGDSALAPPPASPPTSGGRELPEFWCTTADLQNAKFAWKEPEEVAEDPRSEVLRRQRSGPHSISKHGFSRNPQGNMYNFSTGAVN